MAEFIKILLSLSFSGTLLLLFVFLLKKFYKNKFSKCWQYYIWIIVSLRFLLPITLNNTISLTSYFTKTIHIMKTQDNINNKKENAIKIKENNSSEATHLTTVNKHITIQTEKPKKDIHTLISSLRSIDFYPYLFFIWFTFAWTLFLRKIILYQVFVYHIQVKNIEVSHIETLNLLADCAESIKLFNQIELYHNPFVTSPIMIGFFRPKIILPVKEYQKEELFFIFLHELIHYKRRDIFYKWFIQFIICFHWFNPFIYLLGKEVNRACELSCDEAVIYFLGDKEKKAYGDVLISALKTETIYKNPDAFITFTENVIQIKERLGAIMDFKKKTNLMKITTAIFTIIICISFTTIGVYASNEQTSSKYTKETPKKIQEENIQIYNRDGFFCNSYVIEMAWNINTRDKETIADKVNITLKDKSEIIIYFSKEAKEYAKNKKAIAAIKKIISNLKNSSLELYPMIKTPYIYRIDDINPNHISDFAEKYYKEKDIIGFSSIFSALNTNLQKKYYKKIYHQNKIEFLGCIINNMDKSTILFYIKKAIQDEDIPFFSLLLEQLPSRNKKQVIKKYIPHFYNTDNIAFFSIILGYLSEQEKQTWLKQADKDKKMGFYSIISDEL